MSASRARKRRAKIYFATNRRIHGLWQTTIPSRFLDELPADHVEVVEAATGAAYGGYAQSRFANMDSYRLVLFDAGLAARAAAERGDSGAQAKSAVSQAAPRGAGRCRSRANSSPAPAPSSGFAKGARVFHMKFGYGAVAAVDGNKLTVDFDKAGRKMVLESFVQAG